MRGDHSPDFAGAIFGRFGDAVFGPLGLTVGTLFFGLALLGSLVTGGGLYNRLSRTVNTRAEAKGRYWFEVSTYAVLCLIYVGFDIVTVLKALTNHTVQGR